MWNYNSQYDLSALDNRFEAVINLISMQSFRPCFHLPEYYVPIQHTVFHADLLALLQYRIYYNPCLIS